MTPMSIKRNLLNLLGLHLNQKDLKSGKKRLSYAQFTNGRLRDSSEYRAGCIVSIGASFEQKISKIGQETAENGQFTNRCLRGSNEYQAGFIESVRASF